MQIIKNHIFQNDKTCRTIVKSKGFWKFSMLRARTEKVTEDIENDTNIHPLIYEQINAESMLEKVMQEA